MELSLKKSALLIGLIYGLTLIGFEILTATQEPKSESQSTSKPNKSNQFIAVKFFKESQLPPPNNVKPYPPTFDGKAVIKDKTSNYIPIKPPTPNRFYGQPFPTGLQAPLADEFVWDGSETSIAINYDDTNDVVACYNSGIDALWDDVSIGASTDGNNSWNNYQFPEGSLVTGYPYDPWVVPGNAGGQIYITMIRYHSGGSGNSQCLIAKRFFTGGGYPLFFQKVAAIFMDREMVDVDRTTARGGGSGTTHDGKVFLCYDDWRNGGTTYYGSFVQIIGGSTLPGTDLGSYQPSGTGVPPFRGNQIQPVADTGDGRVFFQATALASTDTITGDTIVAYFHKVIGGGTGQQTYFISTLIWPAAGQRLGSSTRWGLNGHRIDQHGYLAIDLSSGARRGYFYFISNRNPNPTDATVDQGDIYLSVSTDTALNWSSAVIPAAAGKTQYFPMLDVDNQGWLHVAYYQNETGSTNGGALNASSANLYYTYSTNGGSSWSTPVQVNESSNALDLPDPPNDLSPSYYLIGDYAQLQATGTDTATKVYVFWTGYDKDRSDTLMGDMKVRALCTKIRPASQQCLAKAGDANGSGGNPNLTDIIYLVNYIFKGGPAPSPLCRGDANASGGSPNLSDIIYLVNYVFKGGPAPIKSKECCL